MARWSVVTGAVNASLANKVTLNSGSIIALLSTLLVFSICVTMLLALCAAHSHSHVLNARRDVYSSEPEAACDLAIAPPEEFKKSELSFRFSSATSAITKLSSSFRSVSFRESSSSFRNSSFRMSSFRMEPCKQTNVVPDVVDALRRLEAEENAEPAVWQKAILRGERCAPLSFSGLILYDEYGNQLPSFDSEESKQPELLRLDDQPTVGRVRSSELETGF